MMAAYISASPLDTRHSSRKWQPETRPAERRPLPESPSRVAVLPGEVDDANPVARTGRLQWNDEGRAAQPWDATDHKAVGPTNCLAIAIEGLDE
jgi:hypothetical protein